MIDPSEMTREALENEALYLREELGLLRHQRQNVAVKLGVTPSQAAILSTLIAAKGKPVRDSFLEFNLPRFGERQYDVIRVYICVLRKRFGRDSIQTVKGQHGVRYCMTPHGMEICERALAA